MFLALVILHTYLIFKDIIYIIRKSITNESQCWNQLLLYVCQHFDLKFVTLSCISLLCMVESKYQNAMCFNYSQYKA